MGEPQSVGIGRCPRRNVLAVHLILAGIGVLSTARALGATHEDEDFSRALASFWCGFFMIRFFVNEATWARLWVCGLCGVCVVTASIPILLEVADFIPETMRAKIDFDNWLFACGQMADALHTRVQICAPYDQRHRTATYLHADPLALELSASAGMAIMGAMHATLRWSLPWKLITWLMSTLLFFGFSLMAEGPLARLHRFAAIYRVTYSMIALVVMELILRSMTRRRRSRRQHRRDAPQIMVHKGWPFGPAPRLAVAPVLAIVPVVRAMQPVPAQVVPIQHLQMPPADLNEEVSSSDSESENEGV